MNIFGYGGIRKGTHGCHGNSLQNGCHGSTNNVAIRHFRASNVAILELMATSYMNKMNPFQYLQIACIEIEYRLHTTDKMAQ